MDKKQIEPDPHYKIIKMDMTRMIINNIIIIIIIKNIG